MTKWRTWCESSLWIHADISWQKFNMFPQ